MAGDDDVMNLNTLKTAWAEGRPTLNGWLSIAGPFGAEIMAAQGYDSLTVDLQHGIIDYADGVTMLQAIRASGVTPLARVPWLDAGAIMKMLDAGALGIICPMINSREEAERVVSYMRYPPDGTRSFGPARATFAHGADYPARANDAVLAIAMIETAEAMERLDEIVTTPGLDAVYLGPADLTLVRTNGRLPPALDREEAEMIDSIKSIAATAKTAGIRAGIHCGTPEYGARAIGWGFDFATIGNDLRILASGAAAAAARGRELLGQDAGGATPSPY